MLLVLVSVKSKADIFVDELIIWLTEINLLWYQTLPKSLGSWLFVRPKKLFEDVTSDTLWCYFSLFSDQTIHWLIRKIMARLINNEKKVSCSPSEEF